MSTSRRTPDGVADRIAALAERSDMVARFVDYRTAGPGTLREIFAEVDMVVCTEDSSTMISEAISARLPVIGVSPARHAFKPEEAEYRATLTGENWCRSLPIADLTVERFAQALGEIRPMAENHMDRLAAVLRARLPGLFSDAP